MEGLDQYDHADTDLNYFKTTLEQFTEVIVLYFLIMDMYWKRLKPTIPEECDLQIIGAMRSQKKPVQHEAEIKMYCLFGAQKEKTP
jgi:uncharacterized protein YdaU (DUF1376 family)